MDGGGFLQMPVPHDKAVFAGIHVVPLAPARYFKAERSVEVWATVLLIRTSSVMLSA